MKIQIITFSIVLAFAWLAVLVHTLDSGPVVGLIVWPTAAGSEVSYRGQPATLTEVEGWPLGMAP